MKKYIPITIFILVIICIISVKQNNTSLGIQNEVVDLSTQITENIKNPSSNWSEELSDLMETVNSEHKNIVKPQIDLTLYDKYFPNGKANYEILSLHKDYYAEILTKEEAMEDIDKLWDILKNRYALYHSFQEFDTAEEEIKKIISHQESWTKTELSNILVEHLSFIKDCHFYVDDTAVSSISVPYFYRTVEFQKKGDGFYNSDNKKVQYVDGYEDLENLFKRSLTLEGNIVYYPITFSSVAIKNINSMKENSVSNTLLVHYEDGTTDTLQADEFCLYKEKEESENLVSNNDGISVVYTKKIENLLFSATANEIVDNPVAIMDMTRNLGGYASYAFKWWENYCKTAVPSNCYAFYNTESTSDVSTKMICSFETIDGKDISYTTKDEYIANDNLLIVLSGKGVASAGELFLDIGRNVENTLFIGENTMGCLSSNMYITEYLPNSGISVSYGNAAYIFPDNYFTECYGLEPDLWCPAAEAEEAALNFVKKNMQ